MIQFSKLLLAVDKVHTVSKRALYTLREESSQTNVILQYKLLASILSVVCSVIQLSCIALLLHII